MLTWLIQDDRMNMTERVELDQKIHIDEHSPSNLTQNCPQRRTLACEYDQKLVVDWGMWLGNYLIELTLIQFIIKTKNLD